MGAPWRPCPWLHPDVQVLLWAQSGAMGPRATCTGAYVAGNQGGHVEKHFIQLQVLPGTCFVPGSVLGTQVQSEVGRVKPLRMKLTFSWEIHKSCRETEISYLGMANDEGVGWQREEE